MLEMKNVRPAFETYEGEVKDLIGYQKIKCHFVFDVKLGEGFRRKARLVGGGHLTDPSKDNPYSGICNIRHIRICIFLAELNGLLMCACDVGNAYLEAMTREQLYIVAGPEFGELEGHTLIIVKALYGLRSSGARWPEHLADYL